MSFEKDYATVFTPLLIFHNILPPTPYFDYVINEQPLKQMFLSVFSWTSQSTMKVDVRIALKLHPYAIHEGPLCFNPIQPGVAPPHTHTHLTAQSPML